MRLFILFLIFCILQGCNKPKTVFICGDHVCINKAEAQTYFDENLSIEVKVLNKKKKNDINLVELNLNNDFKNKKRINIIEKKQTKEEMKVLSNNEIEVIKKEIKEKKKNKKISKKFIKKKDQKVVFSPNNIEKENEKILNKNEKNKINSLIKNTNKNVNIQKKAVVDICTIIEKCSIDEISKYLLQHGKNKKFPDITLRE
jgi:hypothetical protein